MKLLIEAGADRWGHRLICKTIQEERNYEETKKRVVILLHVGASVNIGPGNALTSWLKQHALISWLKRQDENEEELALLLYAAGERLNKEEIREVPDYLELPEEMTLRHLCRESIRKHLLQISKMNLLVRVPKLGLPSKMTRYLLYEIEAAFVKKV